MKFIAQSLSIFIFLITIVPVSATEATSIDCCASHCSDKSNTAKESSSQTSCDYCNPFIGCSCYSADIVKGADFSILKTGQIDIDPQSYYQQITTLLVPLSIWQPPKLSA